MVWFFEAFSIGFYIVQHSSLDFLFTTFSLGYYQHHKCMYYGTGVGAESNNNEKCCMGTYTLQNTGPLAVSQSHGRRTSMCSDRISVYVLCSIMLLTAASTSIISEEETINRY